jgi:twitching motility protein PilT
MAILNIVNFQQLVPIVYFAEKIWATDIYIFESSPVFFSSLREKGPAPAFPEVYASLGKPEREILAKGFLRDDFERLLIEAGVNVGEGIKDDLDFSLQIVKSETDERGRTVYKPIGLFRASLARAMGKLVLTLRRLFHSIPEPREINIPPELPERILKLRDGLVIIAGPTGSGKSTTLASILNQYNNEKIAGYPRIVVTLEKPVEYILRRRYSAFIQREIPTDVPSVIKGITTALRENLDVIVVGEARTSEEIESTLMAAETGHLTFMTLHTNNVGESIKRIVGSFSGNDEKRIRLMLAAQLKMVIVQRLVKANPSHPDLKGKPIPVVEYLYVDDEIRYQVAHLIKEGKEDDIQKKLEEGSFGGKGISMNTYLARLLTKGFITQDEAFKVSYNPEGLKKILRPV